MTESVTTYFVGTAGAGKSTMVAAYDRWCRQHGLTTFTINLDPGAETLAYEPDYDIREKLRLTDIMVEHELGPNGAQIAAADMIALDLGDIMEELSGMRADQVIIDTPGQLELFVFRTAGKHIVESIAPGKTVVCYLLDPFLARTATGFASQLMLAATTQMRLNEPIAYVLSKADRVDEESLEIIRKWAADPDALEMDILKEEPAMDQEFAAQTTRLLASLGLERSLLACSSITGDGMDDVYAYVQGAVGESEDSTPEYDTFRGQQEDEM